jgi:hypothetical protein
MWSNKPFTRMQNLIKFVWKIFQRIITLEKNNLKSRETFAITCYQLICQGFIEKIFQQEYEQQKKLLRYL